MKNQAVGRYLQALRKMGVTKLLSEDSEKKIFEVTLSNNVSKEDLKKVENIGRLIEKQHYRFCIK